MATGSEENESQIQLGYGSCIRGTGCVTACPPGPGATQRLSLAGTAADQDEIDRSGRHRVCCGDEDVTQSPLAPVQRVYDEDDTEMVIRWHGQQHALAPAGQQEQQVTHLAAHSIADGKQWSVWKFLNKEQVQWRSHCHSFVKLGMSLIGSILTTAGLPISMAEFNNRRTVTKAVQF